MSEIQTSPAPAAESAPSVADSAPAAVESPEPSGSVTENSLEASSEVSTEAPVGEDNTQETPGVSDFSPDTWDGNIESLPDNLQEPVQFLHRQLESGYTKKFQSLSEERKAFETAKTEYDQSRSTGEAERSEWMIQKGALENELNLLKNVLDGVEDPRVVEYKTKSDELLVNLAALQSEFEQYQKFVEQDIEEQSHRWAKEFRERHSSIFENEGKREELGSYLDTGWDPEAAAKLVGQNKEVVLLANKLLQSGTPPEVAVEHAVLKHGDVKSREPRPGARLTSGAESRNNPESITQDSFKTGFAHEDRMKAARAAMHWSAGSKLK